MSGFQSYVNVQPAPAVEGDFASCNPRFNVLAGQGAHVAGPNGVTVGAFAWADSENRILNNTGTGPVTGFVARNGQQASIIQYLQNSSMMILAGLPVTVYNGGDFYVKNRGASAVTVGMKVYANLSNGLVTFGQSGSPASAASASAATLKQIVSAANGASLPTTNTCTAGISGNVMTVSAVGAGSVLGPNQTISGAANSGVDSATTIVSQLSGTTGGVGTYQVSISQSVPTGTTINLSGGGLTLTGNNQSGVFAPGMVIAGTNIPAGTTILAYGTGGAGAGGTFLVSNPATTAASGVTVTVQNAMFLTVDASSTGTWGLNGALAGTNVAANQFITGTSATNPNLTGNGGAGTYLTNGFQSALTAQTISVNSNVETKWIAMSNGAAGELIRISDHPLG